MAVIAVWAISSEARKPSPTTPPDLSAQSRGALESYPELVPATRAAEALRSYPYHFGMTPAEYQKKTGSFFDHQRSLASPRLNEGFFELLVAIFSKGDPEKAKFLRGSAPFRRAVAVLMSPSASREAVQIALAEISQITGRDQLAVIQSLQGLVDTNGEKLGAVDSSALNENLSAGEIAYYQKSPANKLSMGAFKSAPVEAVSERSLASSGAKGGGYLKPTETYPPGYYGSPSITGSNGYYSSSVGGGNYASPSFTSSVGSPALSAPSTNSRGINPQSAVDLKIPKHTGDVSPGTNTYRPIGGGGTAAASGSAIRGPTSAAKVEALDPMLSILGGDFARSDRYRNSGGGGAGAAGAGVVGGKAGFEPRLAKDFLACRAESEKQGKNVPLAERCKTAACAKTQECECFRSFAEELPERSAARKEMSPAVYRGFLARSCSDSDARFCMGDVNVIENSVLNDVLETRLGTFKFERIKSTNAKTVSANGVLGDLNKWIESEAKVLPDGRVYTPSDRLSLIMNVLAGTDRGLCLLTNGSKELPWGSNKHTKAPFEFFEGAQEAIQKGGYSESRRACAVLDSSDLSGAWGHRQSDRLQILAFFHVLDQMRGLHAMEEEDTVSWISEERRKGSFESRVLASGWNSKTQSERPRASNALATALDPRCGRNGWLAVLESAEIEMREVAVACGAPKTLSIAEKAPPTYPSPYRDTFCEAERDEKLVKMTPEKSVLDSDIVSDEFDTRNVREPAGFVLGSKQIKSEFVQSYLGVEKAPLKGTPKCLEINTKYLNVLRLLTKIYEQNLKSAKNSDKKHTALCAGYSEKRSSDHGN